MKSEFVEQDKNKDGKLSTDEIKDLRRYSTEDEVKFDADGNGQVDKQEFHEAIRGEVRANREARREQDWKKLTKDDKQRLERYDTDDNGKIVQAAKVDGVHISIESGFRTFPEQKALYAKYGPGRAAPPGQSNHEDGNAVDMKNNPGAWDWLAKNAAK